jgi:hypothetical protein
LKVVQIALKELSQVDLKMTKAMRRIIRMQSVVTLNVVAPILGRVTTHENTGKSVKCKVSLDQKSHYLLLNDFSF